MRIHASVRYWPYQKVQAQFRFLRSRFELSVVESVFGYGMEFMGKACLANKSFNYSGIG